MVSSSGCIAGVRAQLQMLTEGQEYPGRGVGCGHWLRPSTDILCRHLCISWEKTHYLSTPIKEMTRGELKRKEETQQKVFLESGRTDGQQSFALRTERRPPTSSSSTSPSLSIFSLEVRHPEKVCTWGCHRWDSRGCRRQGGQDKKAVTM